MRNASVLLVSSAEQKKEAQQTQNEEMGAFNQRGFIYQSYRNIRNLNMMVI